MKVTRFSESVCRANSLSCEAIAQYLEDAGFKDITEVSFRATLADDRAGIDYVAHRTDGGSLYIDLKELSYAPTFGESPDIVLETAIVSKVRRPGWANDNTKRTHILLFVWGDGSSLALFAPAVRAALAENAKTWAQLYRKGHTATRGHHDLFYTEYLIVPQAALPAACFDVVQATTPQRLPFRPAPIADLPGAIVAVRNLEALQLESGQTGANAHRQAATIESGTTFVYAVLGSQRATLFLRHGRDGNWLIDDLECADGDEPTLETQLLVQDWLAAHGTAGTHD